MEYRELEVIGNIIEQNSVIIVDFRYGYWLEYVTRQDIAKKTSIELWQNYEHVFLLMHKLQPRKPPQHSTKIIETQHFMLYKLLHPP
jgi:hypothetical protein